MLTIRSDHHDHTVKTNYEKNTIIYFKVYFSYLNVFYIT